MLDSDFVGYKAPLQLLRYKLFGKVAIYTRSIFELLHTYTRTLLCTTVSIHFSR